MPPPVIRIGFEEELRRSVNSPEGALYTSPGQSEAAPWVRSSRKASSPVRALYKDLLENLSVRRQTFASK